MRDTIKQKKAAILCAVIILGVIGIFLAAMIFTVFEVEFGVLAVAAFILIYGAAILAVIIGIIIALRQRLKEIESGEEEEAKKY